MGAQKEEKHLESGAQDDMRRSSKANRPKPKGGKVHWQTASTDLRYGAGVRDPRKRVAVSPAASIKVVPSNSPHHVAASVTTPRVAAKPKQQAKQIARTAARLEAWSNIDHVKLQKAALTSSNLKDLQKPTQKIAETIIKRSQDLPAVTPTETWQKKTVAVVRKDFPKASDAALRLACQRACFALVKAAASFS